MKNPEHQKLIDQRESLFARIKPGARGVQELRVRLKLVTAALLALEGAK